MRIEDSIRKIRAYTLGHPDLQKANHFSFDVLLNCSGPPVDVVVFGLNQAEYDEDRRPLLEQSNILEDTSARSFRNSQNLGKAQNWYDIIRKRIGDRRIVLGELFFWSSKDSRELRSRYGGISASSLHFRFCRDRNMELLEYYRPKIVVVCGVTHRLLVSELYGLSLDAARPSVASNGKVMAYRYNDGVRPWLFSQHWKGARGITNADWLVWDQCFEAEIELL